MQEAAYDVLFNKAHWRSPSTERRDCLRPLAGTTDLNNGLFVTQGAKSTIIGAIEDGFGYPLDLSASLTSLPAGWWPAVVRPAKP
jgi:hypothetical protein